MRKALEESEKKKNKHINAFVVKGYSGDDNHSPALFRSCLVCCKFNPLKREKDHTYSSMMRGTSVCSVFVFGGSMYGKRKKSIAR